MEKSSQERKAGLEESTKAEEQSQYGEYLYCAYSMTYEEPKQST
jgi:hypothetical protein